MVHVGVDVVMQEKQESPRSAQSLIAPNEHPVQCASLIATLQEYREGQVYIHSMMGCATLLQRGYGTD